ncbi:replication initiator protein DnaA [Bacteroidales bacterium KA00251]|nr:replication initiator protein DnaA [Bacteroidales bacterium KA00251]
MTNYNTSSAHKENFTPIHEQGVEEVWSRCLSYFESVLDKRELETWFRPIQPVKLESSTLTIRVPTVYFLEMLEANYSKVFSHILSELLGSEASLCCEALVDSSAKEFAKGAVKSVSGDIKGSPSEFAQEAPRVYFDSHLIKNYTFDTFVGGISNNVPRTFAKHICEHPGTPVINPFFIYGAPGVGKTHLLNAIGHQLLKNEPSLRVLYVSTDNFVQQFTSAACNHKTADFTKYYRQVDVLLIDDIQSLIGKNKTQEAFFQIFNHLYLLGKQLVLTCDKPPVELRGMEERLISRIAGSCIAQIERPDEGLRRSILDRKLNEEGLSLKEDVKELIVKSVSSNLRELEGTLTSLMLHSIVSQRPIDLSLAKEIIGRTVKIEVKEVSMERIMELTCELLRVTAEEVRGKSRKQEFVMARQLVMYLTKEYTDEAYAAIGVMLGDRSHSTVVHGCNTIKSQLLVSPMVRDYVKTLEERLGV